MRVKIIFLFYILPSIDCFNDCGNKRHSEPSIFNGEDVKPKQWPWFGSLMNQKDIAICGGTLISERHLLTGQKCHLK